MKLLVDFSFHPEENYNLKAPWGKNANLNYHEKATYLIIKRLFFFYQFEIDRKNIEIQKDLFFKGEKILVL